jgi:hypothetical protein
MPDVYRYVLFGVVVEHVDSILWELLFPLATAVHLAVIIKMQ